MKILVRLDISKEIGTGHFRRITNLSKYMSNDTFYFFVVTDDEKNLLFDIYNVFFTSRDKELNDIKAFIDLNEVDIILIDLLHYEDLYIESFKKTTGKKIVTFHEYPDYSEYSDLKINYNFFNGFEELQNINFLAGPKYIIFDDDIENFQNREKENFIFVSFGGSDPYGLIDSFVTQVALKLPTIHFKIHVGNFNKQDQDHFNNIDNIEFLYKPSNIFQYMASSKLAVAAAGNMMYELILLNTSTYVIAQNQHQDEFASNADKYNCVKYFGKIDSIDFSKLKETIEEEYRNQKVNECRFNLDNMGKHRIAQALQRLIS